MSVNEIIENLNLSIKDKVELFKVLYQELSGYGVKGDTELAHVNKEEVALLKAHGGSGTINETTGLPQYFGGGGGGGSAPSTQTQYVREAPGIEERKIELMDLAYDLTKTPERLPQQQIAPLATLEQTGLTAAGQTGVGSAATQAGIGSILGAQQAAALTPSSAQFANFLNPNQSYVIDEINRQAAMKQQGIADQAIRSGAFGGGREGIQRAELQRATLGAIGTAQQQAYNQAMQAFQANQGLQAQTGIQGGQTLGQLGVTQQQQAQSDINQLMAAGGLQRQLAQQTLDVTRQNQLQQQYEPYQRLEFLKNIYAAGPTSQSAITATTQPQTSPLAQSIGTGIGAFAAYQGVTGANKTA